ncbi:hypothetical protein [Kyrpidia sp.]|uniref:hypothetical protein n=1 Tax=Kyrpidia sp. TaxID=2073077 RepID=UPI002588C6ED|nr:hypothetical protein [Kyrpidia sp.]MCL6575557.1 hypothetical protein [Kyrpidia sp.]
MVRLGIYNKFTDSIIGARRGQVKWVNLDTGEIIKEFDWGIHPPLSMQTTIRLSFEREVEQAREEGYTDIWIFNEDDEVTLREVGRKLGVYYEGYEKDRERGLWRG